MNAVWGVRAPDGAHVVVRSTRLEPSVSPVCIFRMLRNGKIDPGLHFLAGPESEVIEVEIFPGTGPAAAG